MNLIVENLYRGFGINKVQIGRALLTSLLLGRLPHPGVNMKRNSTRQVNRKVWEMKEVERVCVAIYLPGFLMAAGKSGYLA